MSAKQCRKCGRFQGVNHTCPTLKTSIPNIVNPSRKTASLSISASIPEYKAGKKNFMPNSAKIEAIISDEQKLQNTIKALEFSVGNDSQQPSEAQQQMRLRLEATFGNIDWTK
jgi:hypothetical protein